MVPDLFSLAGKVVIVTGAGRGLGRAMAEGIAAAGATTVLAGRSAAAVNAAAGDLVAAGRKATAHPFDADDAAQVERLMDDTVRHHERIDALVIGHGIALAKPALDTTEADWDRVLGTDLRGAFICAKAAARRMMVGRGGAIVMVSSIASMVGFAGLAAYGAAKGGLDQLVRQLAVEWGPHGIRVNAINPGTTSHAMRGTEARHGDPAREAVMRRLTPMARRGEPVEFAGPAVFLCSDAAAFVSGVCLPVDGGYGAM